MTSLKDIYLSLDENNHTVEYPYKDIRVIEDELREVVKHYFEYDEKELGIAYISYSNTTDVFTINGEFKFKEHKDWTNVTLYFGVKDVIKYNYYINFLRINDDFVSLMGKHIKITIYYYDK